MSFFSDHRGNRYPTSRIHSIGGVRVKATSNPTGHPVYRVFMTDGDDVFVTPYGLNDLLQVTARMIPAAPGTFLLGKLEAATSSVADVWKSPVVGYAISNDGDVTPYTLDGPDDGLSHPSPVLTPDGSVTQQGIRTWRSIDDWFSEERAEFERAAPGPAQPEDGDPADVFERHARWVEAHAGEGGQ